MRNVLTMVAAEPYPLGPHTICCGWQFALVPIGLDLKQIALFLGPPQIVSKFGERIIRERLQYP